MSLGVLGQVALTFGALSLLTIGGAGATIPEIHREVVGVLHWMDDATFANLIAIGQAAPGPNVIIVGMIGWQVAGLAGLLTASVAIVLPSSVLAIGVERAMTRYAAVAWLGLVRKALAPIAVGLMLASGYVMTRAADQGVLSLLIVAGATVLIAATRRSPLYAIAGGAILGLLGHRLHVFV